MTILPVPHAGEQAMASTSHHRMEEHPLKEKRRQLQATQSNIAQIDDVRAKLRQLRRPKGGRSKGRRDSNSSVLSSWSIPSSSSVGSVASEVKGKELLVPLSEVAFVPATIQGASPLDDEMDEDLENGEVKVYLRSHQPVTGVHDLVLFDPGTKFEKEGYQEMSVDAAVKLLDDRRNELEHDIISLRDEVVAMARATLMEHLGAEQKIPSGDVATPVNNEGQALNEDGLPFVDPVEPLVEERRTAYAPLTPLKREPMTKEARLAWMHSILNQLEEGDDGEVAQDSDIPNGIASEHQIRPSMHRRQPSAERPTPIKSALKRTGPQPPPLPRFGSSGIRRGFLNLNPSSPAAEQASDPVEAIDFTKLDASKASAALDTADSISSLGSIEERLGRSTDSTVTPPRGEGKKKKKKQVRIQSPARQDKWGEATAKQSESMTVRGSGDEDVEDEARSILELLGLEAIKDHPQAAGLYEALKDGERMKELASKADEAARAASFKKQEIQSGDKPAVSQKVTERTTKSRSDQMSLPGPQQFKAFPRGFLKRPARAAEVTPAAPRISQGVSALERASQSEKELEYKREAQGLKPAVPHARPSKAFAEKLEAMRRGDLLPQSDHSSSDGENEATNRPSKVRFGENADGDVAVTVGTAATPASSVKAGRQEVDGAGVVHNGEVGESDDDEEQLQSIGMDVNEELLDDDAVEALGYFSDEESDPDIGFDEDIIMQSRPQFSSDASEITNEELRREYEAIKASLSKSQGIIANDGDMSGVDRRADQDDGGDDFAEGRDLSMPEWDEDGVHKVSRFKRERLNRVWSGQRAVSNELGTGLEGARNVGPQMLIPAITNVRFPKTGGDEGTGEGHEIELDGPSDAEEDDLEELMRLRLAQRDEARAASSTPKKTLLAFQAPPAVLSTTEPLIGETETPLPAKKVSLFKKRLANK